MTADGLMILPPETWQVFGGLLAILILLGSAILTLRRLGLLRAAGDKPVNHNLSGRVDQLEGEVKEMRISLAETYVRRDDWVPVTSRILHMLEEHSVMLGRLDERSRARGDKDPHAE